MKKIFPLIALFAFIMSSCTKNDGDAAVKGYISLEVNTIVSANSTKVTGVPNGYDAKKLCAEISNSQGAIVKRTDDVANDPDFKDAIPLAPGNYVIDVHSANWDGSDSAFGAPFYAGRAEVTVVDKVHTNVKITCTLHNVKVSVNFDRSFTSNFLAAKATIESALPDVSPRIFKMGETSSPAYFPAGNLELTLVVANRRNENYTLTREFTEINPRDHIILNFKVADAGSLGGVNISIDENSRTYNYQIEVPKTSAISLDIDKANAWGTFALLGGAITGKTDDFNYEYLTLCWRETDSMEWTEVARSELAINDSDEIGYRLENLKPETGYEYKICYKDTEHEEETSVERFMTGKVEQLYNGGFEEWTKEGKIEIAGAAGHEQYWDSSNAGAATYIGSVTTKATDNPHGGSAYAQLATQYAVVKLAAASIFTGKFAGLIGTKGAKLEWGVPFTSRPSSLKGFMKYSPGPINRGSKPAVAGAPEKNQNDQAHIFCVLTSELFKVANASNNDGYELSTGIDWNNDPRVIAYGEKSWSGKVEEWTEFEIPLVYHDMEKVPTHMIIVCSSSKYGDYFYGSDSSVLKIDDFSFVYNNAPVCK